MDDWIPLVVFFGDLLKAGMSMLCFALLNMSHYLSN